MRGDAAPPVLDSYRSSVREALLADLGHRTMSKARVVFAVQHASEIARLTRGHSPLAGLFQEQQPRVLMSFDDGEAAISNASPREVFEQSASSDVAIDSTDRESARRLLLEALELQARPGVDSHSALADEASLQPVLGEIRKGLEARMAEYVTSRTNAFSFPKPMYTFETEPSPMIAGSLTVTCFKQRTRPMRFSILPSDRIF